MFTLFFLSSFNQVFQVVGIIRGNYAPDLPFFVLVLRGDNICGGSIVSIDAVLTAANCLFDQQERRWAFTYELSVFQGALSAPYPWKGKNFPIEKYATHQLYQPHIYNFPAVFDIALIKLRGRLELKSYNESVLNICYRSKYWYGRFVGLGLVNQTLQAPAMSLMETLLFRDEQCGVYQREGLSIDETKQICYSDIHGGTYACHGDIGGPLLVYKQRSNRFCLLGISSYVATDCTDMRFPPIFTLASGFGSWIRKRVRSWSSSDKFFSRIYL